MLSHKYRKIARHVAALVFSFLLTLCFATFLLLLGCEIGIFNDGIILRQLEKTEYYDSVYDAIYDNVSELLLPSGLPEDVMDGLISKDEVRHDTKNAVLMSLKGQGYKADVRGLQERFTANIQAYISSNKITVGDDTEEGMQQLLEEIEKEYERCMDFPFTKYFVRYQTAFHKFFIPALILFVVMSLLICVVIMRMQRWPHRGMRYISYATLAASLMLGVPTIVLMIANVHKRLNVAPKYLYDLMVGIVNADLKIFFIMSCVGLLAFGVELALISRMKHIAEHHGR